MGSLRVSTTHLSLSLLHVLSGVVYSVKFTITNKCSYTVWPAIKSDHRNTDTHLPTTGFTLQPSESKTLDVPYSWIGTIWGRTSCTQNSTGTFSCLTGDCGSSTVECRGQPFVSPVATLAQFDLNGRQYDFSFVRGSVTGTYYNLPIAVVPVGGIGEMSCDESSCSIDLSGSCPTPTDVHFTSGGAVRRTRTRSTVAFRHPIVRIRASPARTCGST